MNALFGALLALHANEATTIGQPTALSGTKGNFAYTVQARVPGHLPDAIEVTLDLAEILDPPDIDFGSRRPIELVEPVVIPWLPGEDHPRVPQRIVRGDQPGRYVMHFKKKFAGQGTLRLDAKREGKGPAVALQVPLLIEASSGLKVANDKSNNIARMVPPSTEAPRFGDEQLGHAIYNQKCACCHGVDVMGARRNEDGPALHKANVAWTKTVGEWQQAILLADADRADVLSYIAPFRPDLHKVLPEASHYVAKRVPIDQATQRKLRRLVNHAVTINQVTLLPAYRLTVPGASPTLIANDPRSLEVAISKTRSGYGAVIDHPGGIVPEWWITLDNDLRVTQVLARDERSQPQASPSADILKEFIGVGSRKDDLIPHKDKVEANDALASQFAVAYVTLRHAVQMYEAEERDRSWAQ